MSPIISQRDASARAASRSEIILGDFRGDSGQRACHRDTTSQSIQRILIHCCAYSSGPLRVFDVGTECAGIQPRAMGTAANTHTNLRSHIHIL
jgi:hypothetical protein